VETCSCTLRRENKTACPFYERHEMKVVGTVNWAGGTIPGLVFFRNSQ
jgi:hypothetical protein